MRKISIKPPQFNYTEVIYSIVHKDRKNTPPIIENFGPRVIRWCHLQTAVIAFTAVTALLYGERVLAYSVLLGGMICLIPNLFSVIATFRRRETRAGASVLGEVYTGAAGKFALTVALFSLCFVLVEPLHVAALFGSYILALLANLAGLIFLSLKDEAANQKVSSQKV